MSTSDDGVTASPDPMHRRMLSELNYRNGKGLEFGPLARPIAKKSESSVLYVDHCSTVALKEKYKGVFPDTEIQEVDIDLSSTNFLTATLPLAPFDYVLASHVAEHIPNLIRWLTEIADILCEGGVLGLVLPDKRFTFDIHRRITPFWLIQAAYDARITRPSLKMVIDHFSNVVLIHNSAPLWHDYHNIANVSRQEEAMDDDPVSGAISIWKAGHYVDTHCLVTTPWDFLKLLGEIVSTYRLPFALKRVASTAVEGNEFYIHLEKSLRSTDWELEARITYSISPHPELK